MMKYKCNGCPYQCIVEAVNRFAPNTCVYNCHLPEFKEIKE